MINNNLDFEKNSNTTHSAVAAAIATQHSNSNSNCNNITNNTTTTTTSTSTNNGNGYFNRCFDNRIAANLAAVLNGSRFRSSSTSSPTSSPRTASPYNRFKASRANSNATAANAAAISNSNSNLNTFHNTTGHHHYNNGMATLARYPPTHLQLNNGTGSHPTSPMLGRSSNTDSMGRRRPLYLFTHANLNCNDNEKVAQTPSSDEDNSPTELNNCKRLVDKPPLVKRLTMGLLRSNEESRPLVNNATTATTTTTINISTTLTNSTLKLNSSTTTTNKIYSNGYVNEEAFEPEKYIASKFGDSCRQSLTAIPMLETLNLNDNSEFNLKKRYLRETSSANSSPKIFANRLRTNAASRYNNGTTASSTTTNNTNNAALDDDEDELKEASWFQAGISRDIAVEVLSSKSPGAFLVRKSTSKPGCYALTLRVPSPPGPKIANYIILRTARGYKIKGFRKEFTSLKCLITHHSVMPELLPVPLAMPRPTNMTSSRRNLDDFDTYDSLQMLLKYLRAKNMENE